MGGLWDDIKGGVSSGWNKVKGAAFGKESGMAAPADYKAQDVDKATQGYLKGTLSETKGEKAGQDVMNRMQAGLGGYTDKEERDMFNREAARIRQGQGVASQQAKQAAVSGGISGGLAAKMQGRVAAQGQAQQAEMARDLSLQNIAEQQRRLQTTGQYAGQMAGLESARKAQAFGAAAQQAQQDQAVYQSQMAKYQMDPKKQSGGIFGAVAERYVPGIGGQAYKDLRFG